jgi:response regulator RpfG family c-di-GMP phosphodiesterase
MYKVKLSADEVDRLRSGDVLLLISKLEEGDKLLTSALKKNKEDIAFLQGASYITDTLLKTLKGYLQ